MLIKSVSYSYTSNLTSKYANPHPFRGREEAVSYDSFTKLRDKSTLLRDIKNEMSKKKDISIGMIDIDNFKSVNELLGYRVGDEFIKAISKDISTVADKHGINAYRFGGDEFVILLLSDSSKEEKMSVMSQITNKISKNPILLRNAVAYERNAGTVLSSYEEQNNKFKNLVENDTKLSILQDIYSNSTIAKKDPYVIGVLSLASEKRAQSYEALIEESALTEENEQIRSTLLNPSITLDGGQQKIYEYLASKYDKNNEIYRLRGWLEKFRKNGFSVTGSIVDFKSSFYKGKQPIDLIDEAGEILKKEKSASKGNVRFVEVS